MESDVGVKWNTCLYWYKILLSHLCESLTMTILKMPITSTWNYIICCLIHYQRMSINKCFITLVFVGPPLSWNINDLSFKKSAICTNSLKPGVDTAIVCVYLVILSPSKDAIPWKVYWGFARHYSNDRTHSLPWHPDRVAPGQWYYRSWSWHGRTLLWWQRYSLSLLFVER